MQVRVTLVILVSAAVTWACRHQAAPPVDTPKTLPPAQPQADVPRVPATASSADKPAEKQPP